MSKTDEIVEIIKQLAAERETFTSDDIRPLLPEGVGPRSIPPAVSKARRDGIVEEVDRVKSSIPERKGSLVPVLRRPGSHLSLVQTGVGAKDPSRIEENLTGLTSEVISLKDYLNATGYICGVEEVATFLLLLASRNWVILAGPSGTGKSSMVRRIAAALDGEFHDVQVKPNWVSSEDSLGYFSEVSQEFVPGVVLRALRAAQSNADRFHFVRLDEMNLASPEYYLAEVLSAAESWALDENGRPHSDPIQLPPVPDGYVLPEVRVTNSVFLIGTVNVDETTRILSPKVLDRSAVYDLHHVDLYATPQEAQAADVEVEKLLAITELLRDRPHSLSELEPSSAHIDAVALFLGGLVESSSVLGGPIGYRQRDALLTMITLGDRHGLTEILSQDTILDIGLRSCVMPKWQGSTPASHAALRKALASLLEVEVSEDAAIEALQSQISVSRFPRSSTKIVGMIKQYMSLGYFSAW